MKGFFNGVVWGVLLVILSNFFIGYMGNWTLEHAQTLFIGKQDTAMADSLSDEEVNLSIAKTLQEKYGSDSLVVTYIGRPQTSYAYYISGVRGTKELENKEQRAKRVAFSKGVNKYKVVVVYDASNGNIVSISNDDSPSQDIAPIEPIRQQPPTSESKDSTHNKDISIPTPNPNYDPHADI